MSDLRLLQEAIWQGSLPLEFKLKPSDSRSYDETSPYYLHVPRLSYLPFLLPRLHAFFSASLIEAHAPQDGWVSFEGVPLKWHYPIGLLYDLFSGAKPAQAGPRAAHEAADDDENGNEVKLPWKLVLHYSDWPEDAVVRLDAEGKIPHDAFINTVKEADFVRNGTAKGIMSLSKADSTQLWTSVQQHSFSTFNPIYQRLVYAQGASLRNIPLRVYLPASPSSTEPASNHLKVIQSPVPPIQANSREAQTLGTALHTLLPSLFPSPRFPILAKPMLHGAVVPLSANLEDLLKYCAYLDGWLHFGIMMMS